MAKEFSWQKPYELWEKFVKDQCAKEGWKIKVIDFENLNGDFYYTKPLTALEKLMKKPPNKPIVIHADMDTEDEGFPIKLSKPKIS
jgi:hypothetical protein